MKSMRAATLTVTVILAVPGTVAGLQDRSCSAPPAPELPEVPADICEGIYNSYRCAQAREGHLLRAKVPGVDRDTLTSNEPRLRLAVGTRDTSILVDGTPMVEGGRTERFSYRDYLSDLDAHFIELQYWEGGEYLLVDRCTGAQAKVHATPVVAPDGRRFVTVSVDLVSQYRPNAIQIWLRGRTYELEFSWTPEWGPASAEWLGPDAIRVSRVVVDDRLQYHRAGFVVLRYVEGEWRVVEER